VCIVLVGRCRLWRRRILRKWFVGGPGRRWCEFVVSERVLPLASFGADGRGLVPLERFVDSLGIARACGDWAERFE
jgi:hypothetical protein